MPVTSYTVWDAKCDECPWEEIDCLDEEQATQALDEHIRENH
jgi:hypothetical protein